MDDPATNPSSWRVLRDRLRFVAARGVVALILLVPLDLLCGVLWPDPPIQRHSNLDRTAISMTMTLPIDVGEDLRRIRFTFEPDDMSRMVFVVLGLSQSLLTDTFQALAVSALPDVPSAFLRFADGRLQSQHSLPEIRWTFSKSEIEITFRDDVIEVKQDGAVAGVVPHAPIGSSSVRMALYPNRVLARHATTYEVLSDVEIETTQGGETTTHRMRRPWSAQWARLLLFLIVGLGVFLNRRTFPRLRRFLKAFFTLLLAFAVIFFWHQVFCFHIENWHDPYRNEDGSFTVDSFRSVEEIQIKHRKVRIQPEAGTATVLAFGGSTTMGDPYDPVLRFDYPSQLEDLLRDSPAFAGESLRVVNFGNLANDLTDMLQLLDPMVALFHPRVVILSSVINNYWRINPLVMVAQIGGFSRTRADVGDEDLESYRDQLEQVVEICSKYGAKPLWIEEFVDIHFFHGDNILGCHQRILREVAEERDVDLLLFQDEVDKNPNRLIFYEFVHPNALGYRHLADRLLAWFEANADAVLEPGRVEGGDP